MTNASASFSYRYPPVHKAEVRRQINKLLESGIISPSSSPYNSPLWIVPKKADQNGIKRWRLVIDFRALNEKTIGDAYPLPHIGEILDSVGGTKYFSVFDLASGFHQIPMDPRDKHKTAFSTDTGHWEYNRMAMGLKGAPPTFQRLMDRLLVGLQGTELFVYIDDIVVYAATLDEHDQKIFRLFKRLSEAGLRLQPEKCTFLADEVGYLGHVISAEGVRPDPKKIKAVKNSPVPRSVRNIKEFLGLVGYYRKFIPNIASRSKPLTALLKKGRAFEWGEVQQVAFEDLSDSLCHEPILQCPNFNLPFILTTDASASAIGAVFSQGKIGENLLVSYASRTLNRAEMNYSASERECLAVVFFTKHFRHYLYGRRFTVVTAHQALVWLHNTRDPSSRLLRWRLRLLDFEYEIKYRTGRVNANADALSRNVADQAPSTSVFPVMGEQKKRGRPPKLAAAVPPPTEPQPTEEDLGVGTRVRLRHAAEGRPSYSYSSDDETDSCGISIRRKARKKKLKRRMVRFHDDSEYLPPSSDSSTREVRFERGENPVVTAVPRSPDQPQQPLEARPSPAIILPPQLESSLADSSDTTLFDLEETVISASQGLDGPTGHSTPA